MPNTETLMNGGDCYSPWHLGGSHWLSVVRMQEHASKGFIEETGYKRQVRSGQIAVIKEGDALYRRAKWAEEKTKAYPLLLRQVKGPSRLKQCLRAGAWRGSAGQEGGLGDAWGSLGPPGQMAVLPGQLICPALALGSPSCTPLVPDRQRPAQCGLVGRQAEGLKEEAAERDWFSTNILLRKLSHSTSAICLLWAFREGHVFASRWNIMRGICPGLLWPLWTFCTWPYISVWYTANQGLKCWMP